MNQKTSVRSPQLQIKNLLCESVDISKSFIELSENKKLNKLPFIQLPQPNAFDYNIIDHKVGLMNNDLNSLYSKKQRNPYGDDTHLFLKRNYKFSLFKYEKNSYKSDKMIFEKNKRKRATAIQTETLQKVFEKTAFPSTLVRENLARHLGMSPRTVQIWFQNKRQAARKSV